MLTLLDRSLDESVAELENHCSSAIDGVFLSIRICAKIKDTAILDNPVHKYNVKFNGIPLFLFFRPFASVSSKYIKTY